jgi:hypothetical protein
MTETPDETQSPDAPFAPAEPSPEEQEEADQEEQAQTPAEAAASHGSDEIPKKLERAIKDQQKRLSKIVGVDLAGQECPTCDGMGYTIGGSDPGLQFQEDTTKEACPTCAGLGQLISHSKAPGHELVTCVDCSGTGWRMKQSPAAKVTPIVTPQPIPQGPVMGFMNPDGSFAPFGQNMPQTVPQSG